MRRPGYLAGYTAFGRPFGKGTGAQMPSAPPAEAMALPTQPADVQPRPPQTPSQPGPAQQTGPAPARRAADPATLARIAQLQARLGRKPGVPAPGAPGRPAPRPAPRPTAPSVDDDDEDEDD